MSKRKESDYEHISHDQILTAIGRLNNVVGEYVRIYPGKRGIEESPKWLDDWFSAQCEIYNSGDSNDVFSPADILKELETLTSSRMVFQLENLRVASILPNYFRGFKRLDSPVPLNSRLVVIDGRNSSGKTSLAEAFEWCFTGKLLRRTQGELGDPHELENCISNQLRPESETTWVEIRFEKIDGTFLTMKRELEIDYGTTSTSEAKSRLSVDGVELGHQEELEFLTKMFMGIPPILMQHSLRMFVHSSPAKRREYFEQLLNLDELASLVEKTVIGDARLGEFRSPTGSIGLQSWTEMKSILSEDRITSLARDVENASPENLQQHLREFLVETARRKLSGEITEFDTVPQLQAEIVSLQTNAIREALPILSVLTPTEIEAEPGRPEEINGEISKKVKDLETYLGNYIKSNEASQAIGRGAETISRAIAELIAAGLINSEIDAQQCPVCEYGEIPTLERSRILKISEWEPIRKAKDISKQSLQKCRDGLSTLLSQLRDYRTANIPRLDDNENRVEDSMTSAAIVGKTKICIEVLDKANRACEAFDSGLSKLLEMLAKDDLDYAIQEIKSTANLVLENLPTVIQYVSEYSQHFGELSDLLSAEAREDPQFHFREVWLQIAQDQGIIVEDLNWEKSKKRAQAQLESIRDVLIEVRQALINSRRINLNKGIGEIWGRLRSDRFSVFSQLEIPEPTGRGLPVKIYIKATLDDGSSQVEVDALRVFSESQTNILGLAAFATRSNLMGHKFLILDDPVQSMDEEHFKTFANQLIPALMQDDTQLIILTHNDLFAREISYACYEHDYYATMQVRHSRRVGCQIDEGNRRVSERLKKAQRFGEEGNLEEAWRLIRIAMERLYLLAYAKHGNRAGFDPQSWHSHTLEMMWKEGVREIMENNVSGSGKQLKEIVDLAVSGAHDKSASGPTNLNNSIEFLRALLPQLRLGAG